MSTEIEYEVDVSLSSEDEDIEPDSVFDNSTDSDGDDVGSVRSKRLSNHEITVFANDTDRVGEQMAADISDDEFEVIGDEDFHGVRSVYNIIISPLERDGGSSASSMSESSMSESAMSESSMSESSMSESSLSVSSMSESSTPEPSACMPESSTSSEASASSTYTARDPIEEVSVYKQYGEAILKSMREAELIHHTKPFHVNLQPHITYHMRSTLIKWLFAFCYAENVQSETMHLAVSYIDRFASGVKISKDEFQLVGATALFIAAKYEETSALSVRDLVDVCGNEYSKEQILSMEMRMLTFLNFSTCVPTAVSFADGFHVAVNSKPKVKAMSQYLIDLALAEGGRYLGYLPSKMAAAAIAVARINLDMAFWSEELEVATGYDLVQLHDPIKWVSQTHYKQWDSASSSVSEQYSSKRYMYVSNVPPVVIANHQRDQPISYEPSTDSVCLGELDTEKMEH